MLVLTRKPLEKLFIGENICVTVVRLGDGQVRLGIDAPREISVVRGELRERDRMTRGNAALSHHVAGRRQLAEVCGTHASGT